MTASRTNTRSDLSGRSSPFLNCITLLWWARICSHKWNCFQYWGWGWQNRGNFISPNYKGILLKVTKMSKVSFFVDLAPLWWEKGWVWEGSILGSQRTRCSGSERVHCHPSEEWRISSPNFNWQFSEFTEKLFSREKDFSWGHMLHAELLDLYTVDPWTT